MRTIRSLKLAESSDTAGLGQNCTCLSVFLCVGGLFLQVQEVMSEKEGPGNPLFLFLVSSITEGWMKHKLWK